MFRMFLFALVGFPLLAGNARVKGESLYLVWAGVIDNGEGDGTHGPHGNPHIQLYESNGNEYSTMPGV